MLHSDRDEWNSVYEDEIELIKDPDHIELVWGEIQGRIEEYLSQYHTDIILKSMLFADGSVQHHIASIISAYEKESEKYQLFFDTESMEEHVDDKENFKRELRKKCPIFRNCWESKSSVMVEWHAKFKICGAKEMYDVLCNLLNFIEDYKNSTKDGDYAKIDDPEDFAFAELNDEYYKILGVIGTGIQSNILYQFAPNFFPGGFRTSIWALYFLSGKQSAKDILNWKSETSEFLMVRDTVFDPKKPMTADHNFDYPYEVYTLYCLRIFREMVDYFSDVFLDPDYRYVFVEDFLKFIYEEVHAEDVENLRASDDKMKTGRMW